MKTSFPTLPLYKTTTCFFSTTLTNLSSSITTASPPVTVAGEKPFSLRMRSYYTGSDQKLEEPYFLDSCFLCQKQLSQTSDIYMYRGNTPFCSQECRQEQIEMDEAHDKKLRLSSKRSNGVRQNRDSSTEYDTKKAARTGTVAVA